MRWREAFNTNLVGTLTGEGNQQSFPIIKKIIWVMIRYLCTASITNCAADIMRGVIQTARFIVKQATLIVIVAPLASTRVLASRVAISVKSRRPASAAAGQGEDMQFIDLHRYLIQETTK